MKFGFSIPVPTPRLEYMYEGSKKAEQCGFEYIFSADHTVMLPPGPGTCFDAFMFLTAIAMITNKVGLCTGVSDPHRFHPALMAQKVATLDQISKGRAMIGIGAGEKMNVDMYGLNRDRPVAKLREYIELLREFWTKRKVNRKSDFWGNIRRAYIQVKPIQNTPPIYIAANGPKTREITGQLGDGWYPFVESPTSFKENKKEIVDAAKIADRNPEDIDYTYNCFVAIDNKNPEDAVKRCEFFRVSYVLNPKKTNQIYPDLCLPTNYTIHNFDMQVKNANEQLACVDKLPETILQDTNCLGSTDDVISSIERFKEAGATSMILMNRGPDIDQVYEIFRDKIIPYFKELER
jgi:alkanesulfonate monooxygenase SsuD/methylene tetrahydromethanopterin reductase-like flavin-dependent oxidoreductase (luciferase family)